MFDHVQLPGHAFQLIWGCQLILLVSVGFDYFLIESELVGNLMFCGQVRVWVRTCNSSSMV
jgi:hypothetical protein